MLILIYLWSRELKAVRDQIDLTFDEEFYERYFPPILHICISYAMPDSPAFDNKRHLRSLRSWKCKFNCNVYASGAYPAGSYRLVRGIVLDFNPSWITGAYKCRLIYDRSDPIRSDRERKSARGIHPKIIASRYPPFVTSQLRQRRRNDLIFSINKPPRFSNLLEDERRGTRGGGGWRECRPSYLAETFLKRPRARHVCYACPINV